MEKKTKFNTIVNKLIERPCYLTNGAGFLAKKFNVDKDTIYDAKRQARDLIERKEYNPEFKRLFFDIETSYNIGKFWSVGYKKNITPSDVIKERAVICISYKWENEDKIHNLRWDENQCDKEILKEFSKIMETSTEVIGHNSNRFDIPWLRTRCLYHRIPFPTYVKSLDTYSKSKSMFNFQSNKLDYIAKFLNVGGKISTGGLELWDNIILHKDEEAMQKMIEYCNNDVLILEDVFKVIINYIKPNTHVGVYEGGNLWCCPNCGSDKVNYIKPTVTTKGVVQRVMKCTKDKSDFVISNTTYKKYLENGNQE